MLAPIAETNMIYEKISIPADGQAITMNTDFTLNVPDFPVIPFVEGDGIGIDVTPVMQRVVAAAVTGAYGNERVIRWMEIFAGGKAVDNYGEDEWLPSNRFSSCSIRVSTRAAVMFLPSQTTPLG